LAELGIPFEIAERVLNHAMPSLEAVYNRHNYLGVYTDQLASFAMMWRRVRLSISRHDRRRFTLSR
jgi:hypothetical protein